MKKQIFAAGAIAALLSLLGGCASGYQKFYRPTNGATPERIASMRAAPAPAMPAVEHAAPRFDNAVADAYLKRGYNVIGYASFTSGRAESESAAIAQGKEVGADLVLVFDPKYAGSTTTHVPITLPTSSTSYSTGTATAYGRTGAVTAVANATTTTYGTSTSIIPITVNHTNFGAVYFVKTRFSLGIVTRELNNDERAALQTNKGAVVRVVVDGTPAFNADVLVGDIITAIDGQPVTTVASITALLEKRGGKSVHLAIVRAGKVVEKDVVLDS